MKTQPVQHLDHCLLTPGAEPQLSCAWTPDPWKLSDSKYVVLSCQICGDLLWSNRKLREDEKVLQKHSNINKYQWVILPTNVQLTLEKHRGSRHQPLHSQKSVYNF